MFAVVISTSIYNTDSTISYYIHHLKEEDIDEMIYYYGNGRDPDKRTNVRVLCTRYRAAILRTRICGSRKAKVIVASPKGLVSCELYGNRSREEEKTMHRYIWLLRLQIE